MSDRPVTVYDLFLLRQRGQPLHLPEDIEQRREMCRTDAGTLAFLLTGEWMMARRRLDYLESQIEAEARAERCGHLFDGGSDWCGLPKGHELPHVWPHPERTP